MRRMRMVWGPAASTGHACEDTYSQPRCRIATIMECLHWPKSRRVHIYECCEISVQATDGTLCNISSPLTID